MSEFISISCDVTEIETQNKRNINLTHPNPEIKYLFCGVCTFANKNLSTYDTYLYTTHIRRINTKISSRWRVRPNDRFSKRKTKQCQTKCPLLSLRVSDTGCSIWWLCWLSRYRPTFSFEIGYNKAWKEGAESYLICVRYALGAVSRFILF